MKLSNPRLWISLISAIGVGFLVLGDVGRTSPGPLASVHAREDKLQGFGSCSNCHGGWTSSMTEACLECHEDVGKQIADNTGLHGVIPDNGVQQCSLCHSDHNGPGFAMVNNRSFALAGIPDRKLFDHSLVGFKMDGRHLELECSKCHENAEITVLPEGGKRFLGLAKDCSTCHEDAHEGRMEVGCATCHSQHSFDQLESKDHDRHLHLIGGHAQLGCRDCHARGDTHSLEVVGGKKIGRPQPRKCAHCHESPHAEAFIAGVAKQIGKTDAGSCVECHKPDHTSFLDEKLLVTKELHAASGFRLEAPHDKATCADCHLDEEDDFKKRHPGRGPDDCRKCHQDPHGGQFDSGLFADRGCVACHDRQHFEPHDFTVEKHAETRFALTGKHEKTDCEKCHEQPDPSLPRKFKDTGLQCVGCHGDAHVGFFDTFKIELSKTENGTCASCHGTTSFSELLAEDFDHAHFTGFPIEGAHAQVDCEECHERTEKPDEFGRTFGRLAKIHGSMKKGGQSCVACHTDPHDGHFDTKGRPAEFQGRKGCNRCHVYSSFRSIRKGFDHKLWTGFALSGAHGTLDCTACHAPLRRPDEKGRTWARAKSSKCGDCHEDPHAGQFNRFRKEADCARCHRPAKTFKDLVFNHEIHSRFPLGDRHKGVACVKCHKPVENGGKQFIRYRPISTQCADCHGKQQDPFRRRRKQ